MAHPEDNCDVCEMSGDPDECRRWTDYWDELTPEQKAHEIVYKRWPRYISKPPKKMRCQWHLLLDDYIPDWKERSRLHVG